MKKLIKILKENGIAIFCFISIFFIAYMLHLFGMLESFQQFVVVIASAAATYIIVNISLATQSKHQLEMQEQLSLGQSKLQDELMQKQSFQEDKARRDFELYNAKLGVYSDFVSTMYEALRDNQITETELLDLRTKLFGQVSFYIQNENVLKEIKSELDGVENYTDTDKIVGVFAGITSILQKDLREDWPNTRQDLSNLWGKFEEISANTNNNEDPSSESIEETNNADQQEKKSSDMPQRLEQQAWHFIMWSDTQLKKLKEGFKELSLVEYGVYWRTNLVKQVGENDVVMLFRRGHNGYVGAYKAVGWRVFYFEEDREEIQEFGKDLQVITGDQYRLDIEKYDIYKSKEDGATTCANIIVEPMAFVENGVGNPGGVYRRTISRYDSHYAWKLKNLFQEKGQWTES